MNTDDKGNVGKSASSSDKPKENLNTLAYKLYAKHIREDLSIVPTTMRGQCPPDFYESIYGVLFVSEDLYQIIRDIIIRKEESKLCQILNGL